jgi:hypothetical protein
MGFSLQGGPRDRTPGHERQKAGALFPEEGKGEIALDGGDHRRAQVACRDLRTFLSGHPGGPALSSAKIYSDGPRMAGNVPQGSDCAAPERRPDFGEDGRSMRSSASGSTQSRCARHWPPVDGIGQSSRACPRRGYAERLLTEIAEKVCLAHSGDGDGAPASRNGYWK